MKKILALVLAVLVALSVFAVATFAVGEEVTVQFKNGDDVLITEKMIVGEGDLSALVPANPTKESTADYNYIFKGWQLEGDTSGQLYQKNTINNPTEDDAGKTLIYVAVYAQDEIHETITFWNLVESIFARINSIFRYLASIFRFDQ